MNTPTPTTPTAALAEQERVLKPLEKYETLLAEYEREDEAYWLQDDVLSKPYPRQLEAKRRRLERLREELNDSLTPALARQYAALLDAHAEALERLERVSELEKALREAEPDVAATLRAILPAPPAPASAGNGMHVISLEHDEASSQRGMREAAERVARSVLSRTEGEDSHE